MCLPQQSAALFSVPMHIWLGSLNVFVVNVILCFKVAHVLFCFLTLHYNTRHFLRRPTRRVARQREASVCAHWQKRAHQNANVPHKASVSVSSELGGGVGLCGPLISVNLSRYSTRSSEESVPPVGIIQRNTWKACKRGDDLLDH